jgi:hypothetical protein
VREIGISFWPSSLPTFSTSSNHLSLLPILCLQHFQPPIPQLLTNHQSLISTSSISQNLLLVLKFFHSLAFSIESLEEIMSKSQLNPEEILQGFKNVEEKFGLIGRRSNLATTFFKGEKKEQNAFDLSYLSNHDLTSNLFQRYNDLHFKLDEILKVGWEKALEFGRDREDGMRLSVRKDIEGKWDELQRITKAISFGIRTK